MSLQLCEWWWSAILLACLCLLLSACGFVSGFDSPQPDSGKITGKITILRPWPHDLDGTFISTGLSNVNSGEKFGPERFWYGPRNEDGVAPVINFFFKDLPLGSYAFSLNHLVSEYSMAFGSFQRPRKPLNTHLESYRYLAQLDETEKTISSQPPIYYNTVEDYVLTGIFLEEGAGQIDGIDLWVNLTGSPPYGDLVVEDFHNGSFPPEAYAEVHFNSNGWEFRINAPLERGKFGKVSATIQNVSLHSLWEPWIYLRPGIEPEWGPWGEVNAKVNGKISITGQWYPNVRYILAAATPGSEHGSGIIDELTARLHSHPDSSDPQSNHLIPFFLRWLEPGDYVFRLYMQYTERQDYIFLFETADPITLADSEIIEDHLIEINLD